MKKGMGNCMYEVKMRYLDLENNNYKFENIFIENFMIRDIEINNEDIALIMIN